MVHCDYHDVVLSGKIAAVIHGQVGRGSRVTATVETHHYGPFAASDTGSPDRLLSHGLGNEIGRNLRRCRSKLQRVAYSSPRLNFAANPKIQAAFQGYADNIRRMSPSRGSAGCDLFDRPEKQEPWNAYRLSRHPVGGCSL